MCDGEELIFEKQDVHDGEIVISLPGNHSFSFLWCDEIFSPLFDTWMSWGMTVLRGFRNVEQNAKKLDKFQNFREIQSRCQGIDILTFTSERDFAIHLYC